jgi:hypothetical protein
MSISDNSIKHGFGDGLSVSALKVAKPTCAHHSRALLGISAENGRSPVGGGTIDVLESTGRDLRRSRTERELEFGSPDEWAEVGVARDPALRAQAIQRLVRRMRTPVPELDRFQKEVKLAGVSAHA